MLLNSVCGDFTEDFCIYINQRSGSIVLCFRYILPDLGWKANTGFKKDSGSASPLFLWSSLKYVCISSWQTR